MASEAGVEQYRLRTKSRTKLLFAVMRLLAAEGARISFEGRLQQTGLPEVDGATDGEDAVLKRSTSTPTLDFIVLPLTSETETKIESAIVSKVSLKSSSGVIHIQIERNGRLAFAAYDNFHEDCVVAWSPVSGEFLEKLIGEGALYSYESSLLSGHK